MHYKEPSKAKFLRRLNLHRTPQQAVSEETCSERAHHSMATVLFRLRTLLHEWEHLCDMQQLLKDQAWQEAGVAKNVRQGYYKVFVMLMLGTAGVLTVVPTLESNGCQSTSASFSASNAAASTAH